MQDLRNPILTVSNLSVCYGSNKAVSHACFEAYAGQLTAIMGNNGCGKTSLIKAVLNLIPHDGCCTYRDSGQLEKMSVKKRAALISYIPQRSGIRISMTVREVCLLGFNPHLDLLASPDASMAARADAAISAVGLKEFADRDFLTLSEGQKQLCLLARTLVEDAPILLLDEPDSSLDFSNRHMLMKHIRTVVNNSKCAIMCIHSPELSLRYCDRILLMKEGKLLTSLDVRTASLPEINEKLSKIYDNIYVTECTDNRGNVHKTVLSL